MGLDIFRIFEQSTETNLSGGNRLRAATPKFNLYTCKNFEILFLTVLCEKLETFNGTSPLYGDNRTFDYITVPEKKLFLNNCRYILVNNAILYTLIVTELLYEITILKISCYMIPLF